jgi:hypothetical protein
MISNPEAWEDLYATGADVWRYFKDGRKKVTPHSLRVVMFGYADPLIQELECSHCAGEGERFDAELDRIVECLNCDADGIVHWPVGPSVVGPDIVVEEAVIVAQARVGARVGGQVITHRFIYQRGCVTKDNRTGGKRLEKIGGNGG